MNYYFRCPSCRSCKQFFKPREEGSDLGCALLITGGVLPALLYSDSASQRIQCGECGYLFRQPPLPSSPLFSFASWMLLLTACPMLVALVIFSTDPKTYLPPLPYVSALEEIIAEQPRLIAYLLVVLVVLVLPASLITMLIASRQNRRHFARNFLLEPPPAPNRAYLSKKVDSEQEARPDPPEEKP